MSRTPRRSDSHEPPWPAEPGRPVVFLMDASSRLERRLLEGWVRRARPASTPESDVETLGIPPTRRRRRRAAVSRRLEDRLAAGDDPLLAPLRVAWFPDERDGVRAARPRDLLVLGDPRDPGRLRQAWIVRRRPDRCRIVAGDPAPVSALRERWQRASGTDRAATTGFAPFVARQAALALERAERRLRGQRYKVPRFIHEDILQRPSFRGALARLARETGRRESAVAAEAARDLREIAATHSPFVIDLAAQGIRWLYTRAYAETLHYDRQQLEAVYALAQRHPVVFLPSHKSNFDHLVLQYALYENGLPPNHTAGGINVNFFPVGPIVRRSGVFFIRRSFRNESVYKLVLRRYLDYLVEKRFPLEWYIEGGRSRSGKLMPPRYGLLAYVVDSYRRGHSEDVFLIPVSIAYDQIQDVRDYVAEQRGAPKRRESFAWFVGMIRGLHRSGHVYLRFGEPLSLRKTLGPPAGEAEAAPEEEPGLDVRKLAFEVAVRINRETPVTPSSLVTLALLGAGDRALTLGEASQAVEELLRDVRRRRLPATESLELDGPEGVRRALDTLAESGVVTRFEEVAEPLYAIRPEQSLAAAYYRNTVIHFFVNGAIAELALLRAGGEGVADPAAELREESLRLRDLLKFEFFFPEKELFLDELRRELALRDPGFEGRLAGGTEAVRSGVRRLRPLLAHRVLRPFLEAYGVAADALARRDPDAPLEPAAFLSECQALGDQYLLQRRIRSAESVSRVLFDNALLLARNRDLAEPNSPDLTKRRAAFADELRSAIRRVDAIDALAAGRRAGL